MATRAYAGPKTRKPERSDSVFFVDAREGNRSRHEARAKAAGVGDGGVCCVGGVEVVVGCGGIRGDGVDAGGGGCDGVVAAVVGCDVFGGVSVTAPPDPYPHRAADQQRDQPSPPTADFNLDRRA